MQVVHLHDAYVVDQYIQFRKLLHQRIWRQLQCSGGPRCRGPRGPTGTELFLSRSPVALCTAYAFVGIIVSPLEITGRNGPEKWRYLALTGESNSGSPTRCSISARTRSMTVKVTSAPSCVGSTCTRNGRLPKGASTIATIASATLPASASGGTI